MGAPLKPAFGLSGITRSFDRVWKPRTSVRGNLPFLFYHPERARIERSEMSASRGTLRFSHRTWFGFSSVRFRTGEFAFEHFPSLPRATTSGIPFCFRYLRKHAGGPSFALKKVETRPHNILWNRRWC